MWFKLVWTQLACAVIAALITWYVLSNHYEAKIARKVALAETAVIESCNTRIQGYETRIEKQQKEFVAIGKRSHAMSQRVFAECKPLGLPGHTESTTRYGFYRGDGLFLVEFAKRCAENLAACKK